MEDMKAQLGIDTESCFHAHAPKLEHAGLVNLDSFRDDTALLVGLEYADFDWEYLLHLAQHCNMKIQRQSDATLPLTGFGPSTLADS